MATPRHSSTMKPTVQSSGRRIFADVCSNWEPLKWKPAAFHHHRSRFRCRALLNGSDGPICSTRALICAQQQEETDKSVSKERKWGMFPLTFCRMDEAFLIDGLGVALRRSLPETIKRKQLVIRQGCLSSCSAVLMSPARLANGAGVKWYLAHGAIFSASRRLRQNPAPPVANQKWTSLWDRTHTHTQASARANKRGDREQRRLSTRRPNPPGLHSPHCPFLSFPFLPTCPLCASFDCFLSFQASDFSFPLLRCFYFSLKRGGFVSFPFTLTPNF